MKKSNKIIPFPDKKYQVIYADPPWLVGRGPDWGSNEASRPLTYPTMSLAEIRKLPVKDISGRNCKLFMWTINKYLGEAITIMKEWGFKYSTTLVWCKKPNGIGLGGTFSLTTEFLLFGYRGKCGALKRYDTTWWIYKRGRHSEKPRDFRKMIANTFRGPYIELFAREHPIGWDVWGDEV